jgi:hypothetical protein
MLGAAATGWVASDPDIVIRGTLAVRIAGVAHAARLDQQQPDFAFGIRLVLDALRDDVHFARRDVHSAVTKIDAQDAVDHDESLIGIFVLVSNEIASQFDDLELVVIHFGDDFWLPLLIEQPEFLTEVDRLVAHVPAPVAVRSQYSAREAM